MLGVSHLRNRRVLSNGFALLGKENLQLMYSDGDKAFGTSSELCLDERLRIASDGIIVVSMEILRPKNADGLSRPRIKGKIRITTRCLWVDKGKLLDALHKAAHAALSSCPINCPTAHIERTVSEVLRKMVRKYSSKRPEVIAVAVESTMGVLSDEPRPRLSGEYHDSFGLSAMNKVANAPSRKEGSSRRLEEVNGGDANLSYDLVEEDTEGKDVEFEQLLSEENIRNPDLATPPSSTLTESADFWELSGVPESANGENGSVEHEKSTETVNENSTKSLKSQAAASKPAKRNEWKPEEIKRLIKMRGEMDSRFQTVKARMVLWEEISATLMEHGIKQTPGQCKSLWSSLVKKYKENRTGKISMRSWPYFDDLDKILGAHEEPTK